MVRKEEPMAPMKAIALFPHPKDKEAFEEVYAEEHVPMILRNVRGLSKLVMSTLFDSPEKLGPFYRMVEFHFPSKTALFECLSAEDTRRTVEHAISISTGGRPIFFIAEVEEFEFDSAGNAVRV
jgi:uncharacterized protein (TIGR02118 family)